MKLTKGVVLIALIAMIFVTNIYAQYGGGNGTENNPYLIQNATHLNNVRDNLSAHFKQTADIDLNVDPYNAGSGWVPIGGSGAPFTGNYNGDGFTVSNLMINRGGLDNVGLFGFCQQANIKNLAIIDANVIGGRWVGILVGDFSSTTINAGNITNCYTSGTVRGIDRVGGLAGFVIRSSVINCCSSGNVNGTNNATEIGAGGLVGFISTSGTIINSFATGTVAPTNNGTHLGGLVGRSQSATITNCFSTGQVSGPNNVGGLIGMQSGTTTTASYWNTQTSQQAQSQGGDGRTTEQMTYPYHAQTYVNWNFNDIWGADLGGNINNGYPYLISRPGLSSPDPSIALDPIPVNDSVGVSVNLERVAWSYRQHPVFTDPVGFRVYMNTTGQFGAHDNYVWVDYVEEQTNYSSAAIVPENLMYGTDYYWKVIPTTIHPDGRSDDKERRRDTDRSTLYIRGDAENVPVWSFTTEVSVNPRTASNPFPGNDTTNVALDLPYVSWRYFSHPGYADPVGFRVYMNTTGQFGEEDDFEWITYLPQQTSYGSADIVPSPLILGTTYYWKVVPTTINPFDDRSNRQNRFDNQSMRSVNSFRGDAVNVPVWNFATMGVDPHPVRATNPHPSHMSTGISLGLTTVYWDYEPDEGHANPLGFRVYMNTTGAFPPNAPYAWVPYEEGEAHYSCTEIVPTPLYEETVYHWRVVPTTVEPTRRGSSESRRDDDFNRSIAASRNDAQGVTTWRFTTGTTHIDEESANYAVTALIGNYPNPFNPQTTISFSLATESDVSIEIYDVRGRRIATLLNEPVNAGNHNIVWNGKDAANQALASGVYLMRMTANNPEGRYIKTERMILLK